jgi:CSLREA domain-containing protein/uncharacterized repeat protein (TIGR01451 family)
MAGAVILGLVLYVPRATAATYTVTKTADTADGVCDADCSLREAIMAANANAGADTIIVPAGTYTLTIDQVYDGFPEADASKGDLDVMGGDLTIQGAGSGSTIIQGKSGFTDRIISVNTNIIRVAYGGSPGGDYTTLPAYSLTLTGVTIQNGHSTEPYNYAGDGGGIYAIAKGGKALTIENSVIKNNVSEYADGGGIAIYNADTVNSLTTAVQITNSTIEGNTAKDATGGGIYVGYLVPIQISDSLIRNNQSGVGGPGTRGPTPGGGIFMEGNTGAAVSSSITRTTISGNTAARGGHTDADGGGVSMGSRTMSITESTVSGNSAQRDGGGLYTTMIGASAVTLQNVTVSGNTAGEKGAGVHHVFAFSNGSHPTVTYTNVTVTANNATGATGTGGLYRSPADNNGDSQPDGVVTLRNTIVAGNTKQASTHSDVGGANLDTSANSHHNLLGDGGAGGLTNGVNNNLVGIADARLAPLANNGGPTLTHALLGDSPALDAGADLGLITDQRGAGWVRKLDAADQDATDEVDIGALEMHPAIADRGAITMLQDTTTAATIDLGDTDLGIDTVTAVSSNPALLPNPVISGTGSTRTLTLTPGAGQYGTATVTLTATDLYNGVTQTMTDTLAVTIVPRPNLTVTKTHTNPWRQGDTGKTYTVKVQNAGPGATLAAGNPFGIDPTVSMVDSLPAGLTATAISGTGWTCTLGTLTCTRSDVLAAGAFYPDITVTATVADNANPTVTNNVAVSGNADNTPGNNSAADATPIVQTADLTVAKSHSGDFQQGQSGATYILTVANAGLNTGATDAPYSVTETLPAGITFVSGTSSDAGWTCSATGQAVTCTRSTALASPGSTAITISVNVATNAGTPFDTTASVSGGGEVGSRLLNNTSNADPITVTPMPNLTVDKVAIGTFRQGQLASYAITVTNSGFADTSGTITVTDTLPAGLSYSGFTGAGWTCTLPGGTVTCSTDAVLTPGGTDTVTVNVTVADNAGTPVVNTAHVAGGGEIYTVDSDSAPVSTTVIKAPDLSITKTHSGTWTQGDTNKAYTITVTNQATAGPTFAIVTMTDTLPDGLTYSSASGTGWTCSNSGQTATCTSSDVIAGGGSSAITLNVNVAASAGTPLSNAVTVATTGELGTTLADNSDSDSTDIVQLPDLAVTKSDGGASFQQGQQDAAYTITVENIGTGTTGANPVTLTDTLAADLSYVNAASLYWTCTYENGTRTVSCTPTAALAGGSNTVITLTVGVATTATAGTDVLSNTATVSVAGDVDTNNNASTDTTTVIAMPDVTITKAVDGAFRQGQIASYTLLATNSGSAPTSGTVTVTDTLPTGLSFRSDTAGTGWSCSAVGQDVICTTGVVKDGGESFDPITLKVDVAGSATGVLTNTATVTGGGQIYTANDDSNAAEVTVTEAPDLVVDLANGGAFTQGQDGTYTVTVTNTGSGPTFGQVAVTSTLPADLSFVSGTGTGWSCSAVGQDVTCTTSATVAAGQSFDPLTLTVHAAGTAAPTVTTTVTVSGGSELNVGNNADTDINNVNQLPDLVVDKSHGADFAQSQQGAAYTITVTNQGSGWTSGQVTVTDTLPAKLTPVPGGATGTGWTCSITGQTVACSRSDALARNSSYDPITVLVNVASDAPASVDNTATVAGGNDKDNGNNDDTDTVVVGQNPDLTITMSHVGDFRQGDTGKTYTLRVHNGGFATTTGPVIVTADLPAGLSAAAMGGTDWVCDANTRTCSRTDGLAAGADYPDITLSVNVALNAGPSLTSQAAVSGGGEVVTTNNAAGDVTTVVQVADLTIAKVANGTFTQGQAGVTYTLTVANGGAGPTDAPITVTDTLPAGLTPTAGAGTDWTCAVSGQTLTCERTAALANGDSSDITLTADVTPTAGISLTNTAQVAGGGEALTTNNTGTSMVSVTQLPDLTLTKAHWGDFWKGRKNARYDLTVTNAGLQASTGTVTVTDFVPVGMTAVQLHGDNWTCVLATVTCTRSDALAPGHSYDTITLFVDVATTAPNLVTNQAAVAGGGQVNLANDTASDPTTINNNPPPVPTPPRMVTIVSPLTVTREATVMVHGTAQPPLAAIQVAGQPVQVDASGNWSATVALQEGLNQITAVNGNVSATVTVVRKSTPPRLVLEASAYDTFATSVVLKATAEPGARVTIEGQAVNSLIVPLNLGENRFTATATDDLGNTVTVSVQVKREKLPLPPVTIPLEPGQGGEGGTVYLKVKVPAGLFSRPLEVTIKLAEEGDATRLAGGASHVVAVATEVRATYAGSNEELHNLPGKVTLIFTYDPALVTAPENLRVYYYDPVAKAWVNLGGVVDPVAHTITVEVDHFTLFAVLEPAQQAPELDRLPATVARPNVTVTGGAAPGAVLTLMLNGAEQGMATADAAGRFSFDATLAEGANRLYVKGIGALASTETNVLYEPEPLFTDVAGHWAAGNIARMVAAGVVKGYDDRTFRPENPVSRAEFAVMLVRLLKLAPVNGPLGFTDAVPAWAAPEVGAAVRAGLILGYPDGAFRPDAQVTRAEAAVMLVRALKLQVLDVTPGDARFADEAQIPDWAAASVRTGARYGLITGYEDSSFRPENTATRAETVAMLSRLLNAISR